MSIPSDKLRGSLRNQVFYYNPAGDNADVDMTASQFLKFIGEDHKISAGSDVILKPICQQGKFPLNLINIGLLKWDW